MQVLQCGICKSSQNSCSIEHLHETDSEACQRTRLTLSFNPLIPRTSWRSLEKESKGKLFATLFLQSIRRFLELILHFSKSILETFWHICLVTRGLVTEFLTEELLGLDGFVNKVFVRSSYCHKEIVHYAVH